MLRIAITMLAVGTGLGAHVNHEKVKLPSAEWQQQGKASDDERVGFTFALKHSNAAKEWLSQKVSEVSDLTSPNYGRYVTVNEISERMKAPEAHTTTVVNSLKNNGMQDVEVLPSGDFVRAWCTVGVARTYFKTDFCKWKSHGTVTTRACEGAYQLPSEVSAVVDVVTGLIRFHHTVSKFSATSVSSGIPVPNFIEEVRSSYGLTGVSPSGGNATSCFTQFLGQWYSPDDLQTFEAKYIPAQKGQTMARKVGPFQSGTGEEAALDAQYLLGVGAGVETWVWTNQNKNSINNEEPWMEFFSNVSSATNVPNVFSISYGEGMNTLTKVYMDRSDAELQKLAARGLTVISASGDNGAGCGFLVDMYHANFPAALPHITSVGATANCKLGSRTAEYSSGGFSANYTRQAWQAEAIEAYFAQPNVKFPPSAYFDKTGRGYPDVAACGSVAICVHGICDLSVKGTSCATPIFSAMIGLITDARLAAGKPPLGLLAPALYQIYKTDKTAFNDVTSGKTEGCETKDGWEAAPGWDPTTGLGTPHYPSLLKGLMNM